MASNHPLRKQTGAVALNSELHELLKRRQIEIANITNNIVPIVQITEELIRCGLDNLSVDDSMHVIKFREVDSGKQGGKEEDC